MSSDRAVRLLLPAARIAFVALRDLLMFVVPLDVLLRPIRTAPDARSRSLPD